MTFQEERDQFYFALGRATSYWGFVEGSLRDVFLSALHLFRHTRSDKQIKQARAAGAAFYAVISFNAKLMMVDGAIRETFGGTEHFETWRNLYNRLNKRQNKRNDLAHFQCVESAMPTVKPGKRIWLQPQLLAPDPKNYVPPYYLAEILEAIQQFGECYRDLNLLASAMTGEIEQLPTSPESSIHPRYTAHVFDPKTKKFLKLRPPSGASR